MTALRIWVPATTANLGAGFDVAAMALSIYNETTVRVAGNDRITIDGEGASELASAPENLIVRSIERRLAKTQERRPPLEITCHNGIPLGRGLGSSAAAIVTGLWIGEELSAVRIGTTEILNLAAEIEGHADNTSAALLGGWTLSLKGEQHLVVEQFPVPPRLSCVLFVPTYRTPTELARRILPGGYRRTDAVRQIARAALLGAALASGRLELLRLATEDSLHQPFRFPLYRGVPEIIDAALQAGAYGAAVSGAGPTTIAFTDHRQHHNVRDAMAARARALHVEGQCLLVAVDGKGLRSERLEV